MKAIGKYVICEPVPRSTRSQGGLYLPTEAGKYENEAVIHSVGDEVENLSVGDRIAYDQYQVMALGDGIVDFFAIHEDNVWFKVEET